MTPPVYFKSELIIDSPEVANSIVDWLDAKERALLLEALQKWNETRQEFKENLEKLPELEKENFRIDSTNRKEITSPNGVKVKENPEGDVREYLEGDYKGEQLFTWDEIVDWKIIKEWSATREVKKAGKKLPASWTIYREIIEKKYEWNYQDFLKGEKMVLAGWRDPDYKGFEDIDGGFYLRCADDSDFGGGRDGWYCYGWNRHYGFSVRCLKD